ncbi:hypothetical protein Gpo141_00014086 [Globisporangium polare]
MGDALPSLLALSVSEVAVSVFKHVHCAEMKKLTRVVCSNTEAHRSTSSNYGSRQSEAATMCALCTQSISGGMSFAGSKAKRCRICTARVCSHCRVKKTVYLPSIREKQLTRADMAFCTPCIMRVTSTSSAKFAVLDAVEAEGETLDYSDALR